MLNIPKTREGGGSIIVIGNGGASSGGSVGVGVHVLFIRGGSDPEIEKRSD